MSLGKINYDATASLNGIEPPINVHGINRGGQLAIGDLSEMVTLGMEKIREGYGDVVILFDVGVIEGKPTGLINATEIKEISERADFPKQVD